MAASYYFYMSWNPKYLVLILFTTFISYAAGMIMDKYESKKIKKYALIVSSILCLSVLFFFKYFNFVSESIAKVAMLFGMPVSPLVLKVLLPVGISFYTFQTLGYVIDVYNGVIPAEHHFGKYATFVTFFPQLVAGPIERTSNLLPQIKAEHTFDYESASYGLKLMAWGFFKKMVIADSLSLYVGNVFNNPTGYAGFSLVLATLFFTFQIYCDFSGYSDIAIGTAKLFGIDLMINFKSPYFSQSIREFWSRWHISLSTLFRDYLYIPLGGNRVSKTRHSLNLLITFLVSGLWHGANWTFVIWGAVHGFAQIVENLLIPKNKRESTGVLRVFRILLTVSFCAFAWVFFASNSVGDAFYVIGHMFQGVANPISYLKTGLHSLEMTKSIFISTMIPVFMLIAFDYTSLKKDVIRIISSKKKIYRWPIYIVFVLFFIFNLPVTNTTEFIYFQF